MFNKLRETLRWSSVRRQMGDMAQGRGVTSQWVRRNIVAIGVFMWLVLSMITVRYDCLTSSESIEHKRYELESARSQKQAERARYMSATREITISRHIDSLNMGLSIQTQPPYLLSYGD